MMATHIETKHDCPVICKSSTLPHITITGDKEIDRLIIKKHGSVEAYLLNKVLYQYKQAAEFKMQIKMYEKYINAVIDAYEDMI